MARRTTYGARFGAVIGVLLLIAADAGATTIAQNSSWTVTRTGATQTFRIVAYGDSIFAGYTGATTVCRRAEPHVNAEYTAALMGQNVTVHRRCQSGAVASGIYSRITGDASFMGDASTRVVMFEMCGNDYLQARSNFKSATGTCNYSGLDTAFANCQSFTTQAMDYINSHAHANTRLKIIMNLYYPGYDADNTLSNCTDATTGQKVNMRDVFLPRIAQSNWMQCDLARQKGFICSDAFAEFMARDYDSNADGIIDSDAIRYVTGESLSSYQSRVLALRGTLRDANLKLVNPTTTFDYIQSDDTHPTFEGATASTFLTTPGGNVTEFFFRCRGGTSPGAVCTSVANCTGTGATCDALTCVGGANAGSLCIAASGCPGGTCSYPDGKNAHWNQNGHDRSGWGIVPTGTFTPAKCGNGINAEISYLPSGTAVTEQCDDGNTNGADGCSSSCTVETGWSCTSGSPSVCTPICGDGLTVGSEQCDDGNTTAGDGCSGSCAIETGWACSGTPSMCAPICGDGMLAGGEQCDDGNTTAGDGCSHTCTVEPGFSCMGHPSTCVHICGDGLVVSGEGCDDGNLAAGDGCSSTCTVEQGWTCAGEPSVCAPICGDSLILGPEDCDDGQANGTLPSCCSETCTFQQESTVCDDGNPCTIEDQCDGENHCTGSPNPCDDGNPCTDDSCDPHTGCVHTNNTGPCSDGNACTTNDTCASGACVGGTPPNCDDENGCTDDSCNTATGCVHTNNTAPCNDNDACTTNDTCASGSCVGGPPPNCDDENVCTNDSCDPSSGCVHTDNTNPCDDHNACTTNDTCASGSCAGGPPPNCNDDNGCTDDSCNPSSGCVHVDNTAPCNDGNACTTADTCASGSCAGGPPPNCDDGNGCTDDSCNPSSGCVHVNNTAPCNDGNACTTADTCAGGGCVGGPPPNCNDGNGCTDDSCNPAIGCVNAPNTLPCNDGNACTTNDTCSGGGCVGGPPPNCNDGNVCTNDTCNPATGCVNTNNTAPCSDGNACTAPDVCSAGQCVSGPAVYGFIGFFDPVDNLPTLNIGKAGRTYPIKWQLPLCTGGYVSRLNVVSYNPLRYRKIACDGSSPQDTLETDTSGSSGLHYDSTANQYVYNWQTSSTFAGYCYEVLLELDNGTTQYARFKFTK